MLEALEDRQVPSSTGVISSITAANNDTVAFTVGTDGQVYYALNSGWNRLGGSSTGGATFRQVSAGNQNGLAVCYAIQNGTGNLWEFSPGFNLFPTFPVYLWDNSVQNYALNRGGVCLQISATRNGECYAIGADHAVWLNDASGSWSQVMSFPGGAAVQISAGVDKGGQDKAYALVTYGSIPGGAFIDELNHDGSGQWLTDQHGNYLRANQISAGIGNNTTGIDLFYLDTNNWAHYFNGSTDTWINFRGIQISAGLNQAGNPECYAIGDDNALYTLGTAWNQFTYDGGWMTQISGAQNDMVFVVGGSNQIWGFDPDNQWAWNWDGASSSGNWHYSYGISANPNS
jgi:hypothetical protein